MSKYSRRSARLVFWLKITSLTCVSAPRMILVVALSCLPLLVCAAALAAPPNGTPCTDDGNPCTRDIYLQGVCTHYLPAPAGTTCGDDGDPCTRDICVGTQCTHNTPAASGTVCLDDGNPCTKDVCIGLVCNHLQTCRPPPASAID